MGIDRESKVSASLQVGPTTLGMVRVYIETDNLELPLDFDPDEAEQIAEELIAAAARARASRPEDGPKRGRGDKGRADEGRPGPREARPTGRGRKSRSPQRPGRPGSPA